MNCGARVVSVETGKVDDHPRVRAWLSINLGQTMKHFIIVASILIANTANAQSSSEFAKLGERSWAQLVCAGLAIQSGMDKDVSDKLFGNGIEGARRYINAYNQGKITISEQSMGALMMLTGTDKNVSVDFAIGAVWVMSENFVRGVVSNDGDKSVQPSYWKERAYKSFDERNCSLI